MTARAVLLDLPGPTLRGMTERQGRIYAFIVEFIGECGYPPVIRQIAAHLECSVSTVLLELRRLEELQLIRRVPEQARAIEVLERDGEAA